MCPDVKADAGGSGVFRQVEVFTVESVDGEDVAVCAVAGRRAGTAIVVVAVVVAGVARTGGKPLAAAFSPRLRASPGRLMMYQYQKPEPVGASGS